MSLFTNPTYLYWQAHISFIWSIKAIPLNDGLISILDQRARQLLLILQQLSSNPNVQISADDFSYVPATYEDILAVAYITNQHLEAVKFEIMNRNIIYLP
jgi:hypothetical protein